jgi:CheY-like chemotaxis protein
MNRNTVNILLVDDDEVDIEAVKRAFKKERISNSIIVAKNGVEALTHLRGNGTAPLNRPFLVLLDLNMPKMNGIELLQEIRDDENLKNSIVFMLTTSDDDQDKLRAYDKNIAGYLVKGNVGKDFVNLVNMLDSYWRYVEFPPEKV